MKYIYIAGFDVFKQNSLELGAAYVELCKKYGYIGLYPLDNIVDFSQPKQTIAQEIFFANKAMIEKADILIANLNSFRGKEPDSGTVWECGYGFGLGKQVYGYVDSLKEYKSIFSKEETTIKNGTVYDLNKMVVEDFGYRLNLMLSCSVTKLVEGGFEDVVKGLSV